MPRASPTLVWMMLFWLFLGCQASPAPTPTLRSERTPLPPASTITPPLPSPTSTFTPPPANPSSSPIPSQDSDAQINYLTQAGDSLANLAARFDIPIPKLVAQIQATYPGLKNLSEESSGFLKPGLRLALQVLEAETTPGARLLPDSEVVFSSSASGFNAGDYVQTAGGALSSLRITTLVSMPQSPAKVLERVALENSINPRLLLALLEYHCGCLLGYPEAGVDVNTIFGIQDWIWQGYKRQLVWAVEQLSTGYYGWRAGKITSLTFQDGSSLRLDPTLNAGSVALQFLFGQLYDREGWLTAIDPEQGFPALYAAMFGDAWERAEAIEPLFPPYFEQPVMNLPFLPGHEWSFTGGPHSVWESSGAMAALDFTPKSTGISCEVSPEWVVAAAPGLVVRSEAGILVQDLDGDGDESTGWVILYVHLHLDRPLAPGTWLEADQLLGHPSCEGGPSTSAHLHIARKYNGEWVLAGGPVPFVLSDWVAAEGNAPYKGTLTKDGVTIRACTCATSDTYIMRPRDE